MYAHTKFAQALCTLHGIPGTEQAESTPRCSPSAFDPAYHPQPVGQQRSAMFAARVRWVPHQRSAKGTRIPKLIKIRHGFEVAIFRASTFSLGTTQVKPGKYYQLSKKRLGVLALEKAALELNGFHPDGFRLLSKTSSKPSAAELRARF